MELFTFYRMLICLWAAVLLLVFAQGRARLAVFGWPCSVVVLCTAVSSGATSIGVHTASGSLRRDGMGSSHRGDLRAPGPPSGSDSQGGT